MLEDKTVGKLVLIFVSICFLYYTIWIFGTPFIEPPSLASDYFPDVKYALLIPCAVLAAFVGSLYAFTCYNLYWV